MIEFKKINNYQGFTLIEVMVSVTLFAVIILSVTSIFKLAIDGQRSAIATQNVQESLKYFLEVTSKEIRMAQRNEGTCLNLGYDQIFQTLHGSYGDNLYFKNYYGECVTYYLSPDGDNVRFRITRRTPGLPDKPSYFISPAKIRIDDLRFVISSTASTSQPMVTMNLRANALDSAQFKSEMTLQTSITSRYYK